jgi:hypothetical protein
MKAFKKTRIQAMNIIAIRLPDEMIKWIRTKKLNLGAMVRDEIKKLMEVTCDRQKED